MVAFRRLSTVVAGKRSGLKGDNKPGEFSWELGSEIQRRHHCGDQNELAGLDEGCRRDLRLAVVLLKTWTREKIGRSTKGIRASTVGKPRTETSPPHHRTPPQPPVDETTTERDF